MDRENRRKMFCVFLLPQSLCPDTIPGAPGIRIPTGDIKSPGVRRKTIS